MDESKSNQTQPRAKNQIGFFFSPNRNRNKMSDDFFPQKDEIKISTQKKVCYNRPPAQQASALSMPPLPLGHKMNSSSTDHRKEKKQHLSLIFVFTTSLAEESGKTRIFLHISYLNSFFRIIRLFIDFKTKGYFSINVSMTFSVAAEIELFIKSQLCSSLDHN